MSERSEHRRCPMTGEHVVVAPGRKGATAHLDATGSLPVLKGPCPFCPGEERESDEALLTLPPPSEGPWRIRVLPNKFPAVTLDPSEGEFGPGAYGVHEIVIESDDHDGDFATYDDAHAALVFHVMRTRVQAVEATPGIEHVNVFRNRGRRAGASQPHPHSQVVGTRHPGREQTTRLRIALEFATRTGTNLSFDVLRREREAGERIVAEANGMISLVAFAPHRTAEAWVVPETPLGSLSRFDDATLRAFAIATRDFSRAVLEATGRSDYNIVLRTLPVAYRDHPAAFTYAEIVPRGGVLAGFEIVTGAALNSSTPEALAELVRAQYVRR
jgi:UDPglucose--hexose-1-phosphate uridylyltransferase